MNKNYLLERLHAETIKMRQYQKQFFKQKDKHNLEMSKKHEKNVDGLLKLLNDLDHGKEKNRIV